MVEIVGNRTRILQLLASTDGIEDSAVGKPPPGTRPHQRGAALAQHGPDAVEVSGGGALFAADAHQVLEELVLGLSDRDA